MNEKPELSDGHGRIANEIMEALSRTYMSSYESQFLWCLFRKTYGWNKKEDTLPISQIAEVTGIHLAHVSRTKKKLLHRRIITQTGNKISFNKYHSQWLRLPKQVSITQTGNPAHSGKSPPPIQVTLPPPVQADSKDTPKDIIQKTSVGKPTEGDSKNADLFFELIIDTNPADRTKHEKNPRLKITRVAAWARDIEKMRRLDGVTDKQIEFMLTWLFRSNKKNALFWQRNIRSGTTLREKWPRLVMACREDYAAAQKGNLNMPDFRSTSPQSV